MPRFTIEVAEQTNAEITFEAADRAEADVIYWDLQLGHITEKQLPSYKRKRKPGLITWNLR